MKRYTVRQHQIHFRKLFGNRILIMDPSLGSRFMRLQARHYLLNDAFRKGKPLGPKIARLFGYYMSLVNYFDDFIDLSDILVRKFPSYGCSYCGQKPCACGEGIRNPSVEREPEPEQFEWSLVEWQKHLDDVYGKGNREKGFDYVTRRMTDELGEFSLLMSLGPGSSLYAEKMLAQIGRELTDILTWIIAFAYISDIDLEEEVAKQYTVCAKCGLNPCGCTLFFVHKDGKHFSTIGTHHYYTPTALIDPDD